ncbi:hypothetical protein AB0M20_13450 [Actinoplanes sp. NPDC051633]|uniref:hypothetical protein n=1 Tax=Actinoplanes sp. NPDC051633 TaxID=3155670 RepID=UPI003417DFAA
MQQPRGPPAADQRTDVARDEVWRRGRTPAADPVFVGTTNGAPARLLYDVEIYPDTVR